MGQIKQNEIRDDIKHNIKYKPTGEMKEIFDACLEEIVSLVYGEFAKDDFFEQKSELKVRQWIMFGIMHSCKEEIEESMKREKAHKKIKGLN